MAKIIIDCADPNDLQEMENAIEKAMGSCNVTYFRQAEAMKEAGTAKSLNDAAEKIAKETGESKRSVETKVYRGKKQITQPAENYATPSNHTESENNQVADKDMELYGLNRDR